MRKALLLTTIMSVAALALTAFAALGQTATTSLKRPTGHVASRTPKIAAAYVVDSRPGVPDANMFTHLIYSFGNFNDDFDEVVIKYPERLKGMVGLKKQNPELKVILGLNDYRKPGFSEMTRDKKKRKNYVKSVKKAVDEYCLDGVDLDWEFPTTENGGHTACPDDAKNYAKLVKELRKALGKEKWISYFSDNSGKWIDHKAMGPYVGYVNVSGYILNYAQEGKPLLHQSPLYPGRKTGEWSVSKAMERHIALGIPKEKLLMGIPFFGIGLPPFKSETNCTDFEQYDKGLLKGWAEDAQAPYYMDKDGNLILGYDNERSIEAKFDFIQANDLPGIFVWHYDGDFPGHPLGKTIERLRK